MGLKLVCPHCGLKTIAIRIIGMYVGKPNSIKIWECRECLGLWAGEGQNQIGEINLSPA